MMTSGMYSSAKDDWETPRDLYDLLDREFHFDLDACASQGNAKCARYYTDDDDALIQNWGGAVFMNPPYGRQIGKWIRKAYEESQLNATVVVCLIPSRTDTAWWHDYVMRGDIRFLRGRLRFSDSAGSAPFPSAVVIFRRRYDEDSDNRSHVKETPA